MKTKLAIIFYKERVSRRSTLKLPVYDAHAMCAYYNCIQQKVSKIRQHQNSNWSTRLILSCASQRQMYNLRLGTDRITLGPDS